MGFCCETPTNFIPVAAWIVGVHLTTVIPCFRNLSALDLSKLQYVQKSLSRIVTNIAKYSFYIQDCLTGVQVPT